MTESNPIRQQKQFKILLIGDNCIDEYKYGNVTRISPEAPVPVFVPDTHIVKEGMAGNVKNNLEALGCAVTLISNTNSEGKITKKIRYIDNRSKQHIIRIDEDRKTQPVEVGFISFEELNSYDAVVISDYDKGVVSYDLVKWLRNEFSGDIFADTKKTDLERFNGCYVKINRLERSLARTLPSDKWLVVTHGADGAVWCGQAITSDTPETVTDVCGAGDTFLSALVYKFLENKQMIEAIKFANKAAAITVQHIGVYSPTLGEIQ